ncbi:MAG TPA: hypothetical protein VGG05_14835 [Pseudonocardiaceae bacterium]
MTKAQLVERGPATGTMVIRPYGHRIWELIQAELDRRIKDTGHAGAARTSSIEGMMRDGKAPQAGTSHYLGANFVEAFGIRYAGDAGHRAT